MAQEGFKTMTDEERRQPQEQPPQPHREPEAPRTPFEREIRESEVPHPGAPGKAVGGGEGGEIPPPPREE